MDARRTTTRILRALLLGVLGMLALALLIIVLALPSLARHKTRQALDNLQGARGDFQDVQVSLVPLRYTITHLEIRQKDSLLRQPLLYAERIAVTLSAGPLLRGVLSGKIDAERVKVVMEEPEPGGDDRLPPLSKLVPVKAVLERLQLRDSELLYAWVRKNGWPSLWVHHLEATLENLGSRPGLVTGPMDLAARGTFGGKGTTWVVVSAFPEAERLTFAGRAGLEGFDPSQMSAYLKVKKGVELTPGSFSMRMRFRCQEGRLEGVIDPHLRGSELKSGGDPGSALKVLFGKIAMAFSGPTEGTRPGGAIAVQDDLTDPTLQLAPRLEKVIENGFSLGLQEALRREYAGKVEPSSKPEPTPLKARK